MSNTLQNSLKHNLATLNLAPTLKVFHTKVLIMLEGHKRLGPQMAVCPCLREDYDLFGDENFDPAWIEVAEIVCSSM